MIVDEVNFKGVWDDDNDISCGFIYGGFCNVGFDVMDCVILFGWSFRVDVIIEVLGIRYIE